MTRATLEDIERASRLMKENEKERKAAIKKDREETKRKIEWNKEEDEKLEKKISIGKFASKQKIDEVMNKIRIEE